MDVPLQKTVGPRYQVRHLTTFEYAGAVSRSSNVLHLEPRTYPLQRTLSAFIRVVPTTRLRRAIDLYSNPTHHFEIHDTHYRLEVESLIRVENLVLEVPDETKSALLSEYIEEVQEFIWPFLQPSHYITQDPTLWRQALDLTDSIGPVYEKALTIMHWIHDQFTYDSKSTHVNTHLAEAFTLRRGVCQDFSHVMIGICRAVGIPCRYASGYLYNGPRDTLVGSQASHAWAEVYLAHVGWIGFDPTNDTLADDRFIKVATGRDYQDVAPVTGTFRGAGGSAMHVDVEVTKLE